ncbi:hypothetical protein M413DRAFT_447767 [Hebeloma cylindrosporum]|uniref:Uncharacterized protein n=1 Tax=Hebeloma cylindrosporum TaxID=76867 RepID=A0A0C2XLD0_HEBCY|nr:hypothetical protein M413DRAFT_447767 [Hebeloma cylindrosporum h7]
MADERGSESCGLEALANRKLLSIIKVTNGDALSRRHIRWSQLFPSRTLWDLVGSSDGRWRKYNHFAVEYSRSTFSSVSEAIKHPSKPTHSNRSSPHTLVTAAISLHDSVIHETSYTKSS